MLFRGGFCNESDNVQQSWFFCDDYQVNGREAPRSRSGEEVYLVAFSTNDPGTNFFQGFENEGDIFLLNRFGGISQDTNITMYADNNLVPSNVLQSVQFHTSCSPSPPQQLRMLDVFGSHQVVFWVNEGQGAVWGFASGEIIVELTIAIPSHIEADNVTITSLTGSVSWLIPDPTFDLTDKVNDTEYQPGAEFSITIPGTIAPDATQELVILSRVEGFTVQGVFCYAIDRYEFQI